ncbi:uncharacterized protein LOC131207194 [Anopheles bellator]|uniref:uncharacterized protein LOC131207194 n=1 Tax=Anopheles bellator TaxID=139047 RepID=UPI0026479D5C|nr:uncharacterized protein LOC131207194 [Anopheles bellator]
MSESARDTASFFSRGNSAQFEHVLALYPQVLQLKAQSKCKRPDDLIQLDDWYQNKLPQLIQKRGKDPHILHEELVKTMKWKQTRGKFFPQLSYLIKVNTPRAVQAETKKAFRKLPNLEQAITALSNLKGVGTTMASALLAAAAPETAPFMADECLMAIPEIEGIDYTTREYMNFVKHIRTTTDRLNRECHPVEQEGEEDTANLTTDHRSGTNAGRKPSSAAGNGTSVDDCSDGGDDSNNSSTDGSSSGALRAKHKPDASGASLKPHEKKWSPHRVELALWTHYVASELQPELLENIPEESPGPVNSLDGTSPSAVDITTATTTCSTNSSNHTTAEPPKTRQPADGGRKTATNGGGPTSAESVHDADEEPSDESNCETEHDTNRGGGLTSDGSSKYNKFLDSPDGDCTKSEEDSREQTTGADARTGNPTQLQPAEDSVLCCENLENNNNSSNRTDTRTDSAPLNDEDGEQGSSEDEPPASKKPKIG